MITDWNLAGTPYGGVNGSGISTPFGPSNQSKDDLNTATTDYAFVQNSNSNTAGTLSQDNLDFLPSTTYTLTFDGASRSDYGTNTIEAIVNDGFATISDTKAVYSTSEFTFTTVTFTTSASATGAGTLTFQNDSTGGGDNTIDVTNVAITQVASINPVLIQNGDFQSNASAFSTSPGYIGGSNPASIPNWTAANTQSGNTGNGVNGSGISNPFGPSNQSTDNLGNSITDYGFVQGAGGRISQSGLDLMPDTTYVLTFDGASRSGYNPNGIETTINDGFTNVSDTSASFGSSQFTFTTVIFTTSDNANGAGTVTFQNDGNPSGDDTIDVTNVALTLVSSPTLVQNGNFQANASSFTNPPGYTNSGSNPTSIAGWVGLVNGTSNAGNGVDGSDTQATVFGPSNQSTDNLGNPITDYAFVQGSGSSLNQPEIDLLPNSTYTLTFDGASRAGSGYSPNTIEAIVNDGFTNVSDTSASYGGSGFTVTTVTFTTSAFATGAGTLTFQNDGGAPGGDATIDVTNVALALVSSNKPLVQNGNFQADAPAYTLFPGYTGNATGQTNAPNPGTITDWVGTGTGANNGGNGINGTDAQINVFGPADQYYDNVGNPIRDYAVDQGPGGTLTQTGINLLPDTTYTLTFDGASRNGNNPNNPSTIEVIINDGSGSAPVSDTEQTYGNGGFVYKTIVFTTSSNANGSGSLVFQNDGGTPAGDYTVDVTNVAINPVAASVTADQDVNGNIDVSFPSVGPYTSYVVERSSGAGYSQVGPTITPPVGGAPNYSYSDTGPFFSGTTYTYEVIPYEGATAEPAITSNSVLYVSGTLQANYASGFPGGAGSQSPGLTYTEGTVFQPTNTDAGDLQLTDTQNSESDSVFTTAPLTETGDIESSFDFQINTPGADGFTFLLQNNTTSSVGAAGSSLAVLGNPSPYSNSVGIAFNQYQDVSQVALIEDGQGLGAGGALAYTTISSMGNPFQSFIASNSSDVLQAAITVDASTDATTGADVFVVIRDPTTGLGFSTSYTLPVSFLATNNLTGPTSADYAGFTAATGGINSNQYINDWTVKSSQPSVTAVSVNGTTPAQGPTSGGTTVTITGTGFTTASTVTFGGNSALPVTVISPTQITAVDPAGTGTVDVQVTTAGGTSTTSTADQFTYTSVSAATLVSITPQDPTHDTTTGSSAQRSIETQIKVVFSEAISALPTNILTLTAVNGDGNTVAGGSQNTQALGTATTPDGGITWYIPIIATTNNTYSYALGAAESGQYSLKDGVYELTVNGSITPTGGSAQTLYNSGFFQRYFGDIKGTGHLNAQDSLAFKNAFNAAPAVVNEDFDQNGDGNLNGTDSLQFKNEFNANKTYSPPSGIISGM